MQKERFKFIQSVRDFFNKNDFLQIDVPPIVENPGMEVHIHPFKVKDKYLHTSPEFFLKKILATSNFKNIYSLGYSYRDEPHSPIHREQFLMLEWYRVNQGLEKMIQDVKSLLTYLQKIYTPTRNYSRLQIVTMNELFEEHLNISILDFLELDKIKELIKNQFPEIYPSEDQNLFWDDYFFLLFLNYIEPKLMNFPSLIIKDYPSPLCALSKVEGKIAKRFELYINGVEIANCFEECTSREVLEKRFKEQNDLKKLLYNYSLPEAKEFLKTMEKYPESSGIALGVERLMSFFIKLDNIFLS